jgi:hypothetical protein
MSEFRKIIKNKKKNLATQYIQSEHLAYIKICELESGFSLLCQ